MLILIYIQQYHGGDWFDYSMMFFSQNKIISLWPLNFTKIIKYKLSSFGVPLLPPVFSNYV